MEIVTVYISQIMMVLLLFDPQFDEFILVSLYVYMGGGGEPKQKYPPLLCLVKFAVLIWYNESP